MSEAYGGMAYCYADESGNVEAVLGFRRDWLLYDIANYAYVEGHVMDPDAQHSRHMVQDVAEEGNVDRVTRILDLAVAQCKEMLYPFTKYDISNHELDDKLREPGVYGIVLSLPSDFSQTTVNLLERLIHEYIVCYAMWDWLSITNTQKAEVWKEKWEDMESQVRVALHSRMSRVRIKPSVF